ncbi:MAG: SsrA-binding protein SmpB [Bacteroidales bacterium]|nr:SsrA-binding protein SmpB [Bacteroidales bacterium]
MAEKQIYIKNKRASHDFEFLDNYTAGIIITGTEIKSIRTGKVNLVDSFCYFQNNELWVKGIHIAEYSFGSYSNHVPTRERKLLLNRKELNKLQIKLKNKGLTIIVKSLYLTDRGWAKIDIALAQGKKEFDKREDLKLKDAKREMDKIKKNF